MESTLSAPEYVGALDKGGTQVKAWKYTIDHASEIVVVSTFSVKDGQTGTVTDFSYDLANAQVTTAVLQKGDTATVRITVRNNAGVEANSTSLFVPPALQGHQRERLVHPRGYGWASAQSRID
ncbi:hypothetical protein [Olsenella sp. Marseille-P4559]|uniref:hypothetical protein n=1 Tax=Olsenella sp. Marseille-P4559 TaxID=2364795 RepID=UPI001A9242D4|nr:hypothetical protein [Olsenella sp. Marseille-P4559]